VTRETCKRGHSWTPENTYINGAGDKQCRVCIRDGRRGRPRTPRRAAADPFPRDAVLQEFPDAVCRQTEARQGVPFDVILWPGAGPVASAPTARQAWAAAAPIIAAGMAEARAKGLA